MIDSVQLVLFIAIIILTILTVVLGIQVFFILQEIRKTLSRTNDILENAHTITQHILGPVSNLASLSTTLKTGSVITVLRFFKNFLSHKKEGE